MVPDYAVFLVRTRPEHWRRYPKEIRTALLEGIERIARIRADIARSAKVATLPRVRGYDEIWWSPDKKRAIYGYAGFVPIDGKHKPAIHLSAPVVACEDERAVRGMLVHEIAHCFQIMTISLDATDSGAPPPDLDSEDVYWDAEYEARLLPKPEDWFGDDDARLISHWDDPISHAFQDRVEELNMFNHLTNKVPPLEESNLQIGIPSDVGAHIRYLRGKRDEADSSQQ